MSTRTDETTGRAGVRLAAVLAAGAVGVQMAFPFTDGGTLALTAASVVLLSAAAVVHALATRGARTAAVLVVVAGGGGLLAEAVGVRTGFPFGEYAYSGTLGWEVLGVPALVPMAWTMMAWPALLVARWLVSRTVPAISAAGSRLAVALLGAWTLTAWDVFLDPQMVDLGHWTWADPTPGLPGVEGIPLTNFAGWLLVSFLMVGVLDRLVDPGDGPDGVRDAVPFAVYLWTYFSSVLAHAVFFGRPPVALVGAVVMGAVAVPLALTWLRARPVPTPAPEHVG
ncbi:carotenoid biosynthesis protein [Nocardioides sp. CFH 31398]|uniref:carotenoid biosynthesis protein n=1 Tax=Nocardioides sp. CFH 31398 TaxID=2919579 RepID=UPI001F0552D3|nr:carotenoid biosynthesis protein [Nocardioides sp. CFH 31398]MCH1865574.1 carotenoid biosynthesis protein [Nocardioides sp. CFH 31398]